MTFSTHKFDSRTFDDDNIYQAFLRQVESNPNAIAIRSFQTDGTASATLSFRELDAWAGRISAELASAGVTKGTRVVLAGGRSVANIAAFLAVARRGGSYVPLDPELPRARREALLQAVSPYAHLIVEDDVISCETRGRLSTGGGNPDVACVLFTSGSTGEPKGVCVPHAGILRLVHPANTYLPFNARLQVLHLAPTHFDAASFEIWAPLLHGGTCVVIEGAKIPTFETLAGIIGPLVNTAWFTSSLFNAIVDDCSKALKGLDTVLVGGEVLSVEHVRRARELNPAMRLVNGYGPTENSTFTSCHVLEPGTPTPERIPIGHPLWCSEVVVVDEKLSPVPDGAEGELIATGPGVAIGYLGESAAKAGRFIAMAVDGGAAVRAYRSGDIVRRDEEGTLHFVRRADEQLKIEGHRIEPGEIQRALCAIEGILDAHVAVRTAPNGQPRLVAWIRSPEPHSAMTLREALAESLPNYMIPSRFLTVATLPRKSNGKLDVVALPDPFRQRKTDAPVSVVDRVWRAVLGELPPLDVAFFDAGGTSLEAVRVAEQVGRMLGIKLPTTFALEYPTRQKQSERLTALLKPYSPASEDTERRASDRTVDTRLAVVGMACRYPGAPNKDAFWDNLVAGRESVRFFKPDELDPSISSEEKSRPDYVAAKGVMDGFDRFDAAFFGISPREAEIMEPQQRIALELAWHALEDAGVPLRNPDGPRVGVFAGMNWARYYQANVRSRPDAVASIGEFQASLANEAEFIASRISYKLNLRGPSMNVQTACSTSLVAIAEACRSLRDGSSDVALAGGISLSVPVNAGYRYQEGGMLSADGHCRPFDAEASGTTFNDGAGFVVLKRYEDALRDGDSIYAVVRGCAVNNDGADKASFTAPSHSGQLAVYREALADAELRASDIGMIEAHGTATPLGDPMEVRALAEAYASAKHDRSAPIALGSVKSNIGHTVHAAGVAGFIKAVLALQQKVLPGTLHYKQANKSIELDATPFKVSRETRAWPEYLPTRAAVSALGVGGTNAHVVLERTPAEAEKPKNQGTGFDAGTVLISAPTVEALERQLDVYREQFLREPLHRSVSGLARSSFQGRTALKHRAAVRGTTVRELAATLETRNGMTLGAADERASVWVFSGQGSQTPAMGRYWYDYDSIFRDRVNQGCALLQAEFGIELLGAFDGSLKEAEALFETHIAQPLIFIYQVAMTDVLRSNGLRPDACIGHSLGEFAAAACAGVFSFEDGLRIVARRGQLMQNTEPGVMTAVAAAPEDLEELLGEEVSFAAFNAEKRLVLSGPEKAIATIEDILDSRSIAHSRLSNRRAFHSPMMEPAVAPFEEAMMGIVLERPQLPLYSTVTGEKLTDRQARDVGFWAAQMLEPVMFHQGLRSAVEAMGAVAFVEVGPGASLQGLLRSRSFSGAVTVAADADSGTSFNAIAGLNASLRTLWVNGAEVDWSTQYDEHTAPERLPGYAFAPTRFWLEPGRPVADARADARAGAETTDQCAEETPNSAQAHQDVAAAPAGETLGDRLADILAEVTGEPAEVFDRDATFVDQGLDSLLLTQYAVAVEQEVSVGLTFRDLMTTATSLKALATLINARSGANSGEGIPVKARLSGMTDSLGTAGSSAAESEASQAGPVFRATATAVSEMRLSSGQQKWVEEQMRAYVKMFAKSRDIAASTRGVLADPRSVSEFHEDWKDIVFPITTRSSSGAYLQDVDGNTLIDVTNGFGPILFGHGPDFLKRAVIEQVERGVETGPQSPLAGTVAAQIAQLTGAERVGFASSGSEAVLGAVRLARTVTGRYGLAVFDGSYHGIADEALFRGARDGKGLPGAPGIPKEKLAHVRVLPWGSDDAIEFLRENGRHFGAILVEPVQSRKPAFASREYLQKLRDVADETGAALIFDEIVTGFRVAPGGIQQRFGIRADLATYGKVLGGGYPIGAIAGKAKFLDALDGGGWSYGDDSRPEVGVTFFAGTFVRHPLALAAAHAVLERIHEEGGALYDRLEAATAGLADRARTLIQQLNCSVRFENFASLFYIAAPKDSHWGHLLFRLMQMDGIHVQATRPCFLTAAHSVEDIEAVFQAFKSAMTRMVANGLIAGDMLAAQRLLRGQQSGFPPPGARLGKNADGQPAYFIEDPNTPGQYLEVGQA